MCKAFFKGSTLVIFERTGNYNERDEKGKSEVETAKNEMLSSQKFFLPRSCMK